MNILMICHFVPYPPHGGSLQRTFNVLREIAKDNKVHLLALNQKALLQDKDSVDAAVKVLSGYCESIKVFDIPAEKSELKWNFLLLSNLLSTSPYSLWKFRAKLMRREIEKELHKIKFDLVFFDTIDLAQYAGPVGNIPKILNHHNVESDLLLRRGANEKNPLLKLYLLIQGAKLRGYETKQIGKFDVNFVVSDGDGDNLRKLSPDAKFETIPNGTDIEYFTPQSGEPSNELVFAGGMNWYPNRDAMIFFCDEVLPLVKKAIPDVVMNIIGQDPPNEIKKMALQDSSIKVHGFVKDTRDFIARSAVYVCPIRVGGGTRLKILDAFACGKALVSTKVGCEGIEVTPGQDILISDTAEGFAKHVINLMINSELRQKLELNARKLVVDKYSWHIIGQKIRNVLNNTANE